MSDVIQEATIRNITDDGEAVKVTWELADHQYLPSLFLYDNRDSFYESTSVSERQCKSLINKTYMARVYRHDGKTLVDPASLFVPAKVVKPGNFNPALLPETAKTIKTVPTAQAPVLTKEIIVAPTPILKASSGTKAGDTKALNKISETIENLLRDNEDRVLRLKQDSKDAIIVQKLFEVQDLIDDR